YQRVKKNGGAAGVDGMTVDEMYPYLREHGRELVTLMIAVLYNKNPEIISILLKNGADVKAKDKYGKRAIDYAREYDKHKNTDAIRELEEAVK
ncbi:MAG: ankyrin repeat domain-containing protein, partial [Synergistaceae bacterium]|nr:ankyrin repeat domain-containing protein [Synergistaceae bacterium]